nr:uncharacterized protein LOC117988062 [Maniola hyperantus]
MSPFALFSSYTRNYKEIFGCEVKHKQPFDIDKIMKEVTHRLQGVASSVTKTSTVPDREIFGCEVQHVKPVHDDDVIQSSSERVEEIRTIANREVSEYDVAPVDVDEIIQSSSQRVKQIGMERRGRKPKVDFDIQKKVFLKHFHIFKNKNKITLSNPIFQTIAKELDYVLSPPALFATYKRKYREIFGCEVKQVKPVDDGDVIQSSSERVEKIRMIRLGRKPKVDFNVQKKVFLKHSHILETKNNIKRSNPIFKTIAKELDNAISPLELFTSYMRNYREIFGCEVQQVKPIDDGDVIQSSSERVGEVRTIPDREIFDREIQDVEPVGDNEIEQSSTSSSSSERVEINRMIRRGRKPKVNFNVQKKEFLKHSHILKTKNNIKRSNPIFKTIAKKLDNAISPLELFTSYMRNYREIFGCEVQQVKPVDDGDVIQSSSERVEKIRTIPDREIFDCEIQDVEPVDDNEIEQSSTSSSSSERVEINRMIRLGRKPKVDFNVQKKVFLKHSHILETKNNIKRSNPIFKTIAKELDNAISPLELFTSYMRNYREIFGCEVQQVKPIDDGDVIQSSSERVGEVRTIPDREIFDREIQDVEPVGDNEIEQSSTSSSSSERVEINRMIRRGRKPKVNFNVQKKEFLKHSHILKTKNNIKRSNPIFKTIAKKLDNAISPHELFTSYIRNYREIFGCEVELKQSVDIDKIMKEVTHRLQLVASGSNILSSSTM